jgi:hypothetical protein
VLIQPFDQSEPTGIGVAVGGTGVSVGAGVEVGSPGSTVSVGSGVKVDVAVKVSVAVGMMGVAVGAGTNRRSPKTESAVTRIVPTTPIIAAVMVGSIFLDEAGFSDIFPPTDNKKVLFILRQSHPVLKYQFVT